MSAHNDSRRTLQDDVGSRYYYRRPLRARELLPALGAAIGAGAVAFYVAKLFLERTPLQTRSIAAGTSPLSGRLAESRERAPHPSRR